MSYIETRARSNDSQTSKDAAKHSAGIKASQERREIRMAIRIKGPMTARELSAFTGIDYIEVQRRISEVSGIVKSGERRGGCMVWKAV